MARDPAADLGRIEPAAVIETAVLVAAGGCVVFGLGVTQQHQTAHGAISIRFKPD
jgi:hypothetical protein